MDGLARAAGSGMDMELGGRTIMLSPLTLNDIGTVEQHLLAKRKNPLQIVAEAKQYLSDEDYKMLLSRAYEDARKDNKISPAELSAFMDSLEGVVYTIWLCSRKNHPELTLEWFNETINSMAQQGGDEQIQEIIRRRDMASGLDEMGNSIGPDSKPTTPGPDDGRGSRSGSKVGVNTFASSRTNGTGVQMLSEL